MSLKDITIQRLYHLRKQTDDQKNTRFHIINRFYPCLIQDYPDQMLSSYQVLLCKPSCPVRLMFSLLTNSVQLNNTAENTAMEASGMGQYVIPFCCTINIISHNPVW
jgi:hypothetical protein